MSIDAVTNQEVWKEWCKSKEEAGEVPLRPFAVNRKAVREILPCAGFCMSLGINGFPSVIQLLQVPVQSFPQQSEL